MFQKFNCQKPSSNGNWLPAMQVFLMLKNVISSVASVYTDGDLKLNCQGQAWLSCLFVVLFP